MNSRQSNKNTIQQLCFFIIAIIASWFMTLFFSVYSNHFANIETISIYITLLWDRVDHKLHLHEQLRIKSVGCPFLDFLSYKLKPDQSSMVPIWESLGTFWESFKTIWLPFWSHLGPFGSYLGIMWDHLRVIWDHLKVICNNLEVI